MACSAALLPHGVPTSVAWSNDSTKCGLGGRRRRRSTICAATGPARSKASTWIYGSVSGSVTLLTAGPPLRFEYNSKITDVVLRAGMNYHFGGPVVAKY